MRRIRMRAALLVAVAVVIAGIGYGVARSVRARRPKTVADLGPDFIPEAAQHIQNFRRVKMHHGRMVWEITAQDASFFEHDEDVVVREPRVTLFLSDGARQAHIAGREGTLMLDGHELRTLRLRGAVRVEIDDLVLTTEEALYDRAADRITAPGAVQVQGKTLELTGEGMEMDVAPQLMRVLREVHTLLKSDAAS
ncbi:MAG: LPS export ABC transporter periplasmic protein LptC [Candidatus Binatia bacterium]